MVEYAGTYLNKGYGAITLCAYSSSSHHCTALLSDFGSLEPFGRPSKTALYAHFPRIWSSHMRFSHRTNDTFSLEATAVFPNGYGKNTTAFETYETGEGEGRVEFIVEDKKVKGFAMVFDEDAATSRSKAGGGIEDTADAWFVKV